MQDGKMSTAEVVGGCVHKFRRTPNAGPATVMGQELRYSATGTR
jgi:hypothetical protein